MPTDNDVQLAMDDMVRMAADANIQLPKFEAPPSIRQEVMLQQILQFNLPPTARRTTSKRWTIIFAATGLAAACALGIAVVAQQAGNDVHKSSRPAAPTTHPARSAPTAGAEAGPDLPLPTTPAQWLVGQTGKDSVIARRIGDFVYDAAASKDSHQQIGRVRMEVISSLEGSLHAGDTFIAESPVARHGSKWDSQLIIKGNVYLLFPDSAGAPTYVVHNDIYRRLDEDHFELLVSTGSARKVQPHNISIREFRAVIAKHQ